MNICVRTCLCVCVYVCVCVCIPLHIDCYYVIFAIAVPNKKKYNINNDNNEINEAVDM